MRKKLRGKVFHVQSELWFVQSVVWFVQSKPRNEVLFPIPKIILLYSAFYIFHSSFFHTSLKILIFVRKSTFMKQTT